MTIIRKILNDNFFRHSTIFFIGSFLIAVLNYLYNPALGRIMSIEEFGEVQVLISIYLLLAIFVSVFGIAIMNISANLENEDDKQKIVVDLQNISLYLILILSALILLFSRSFKMFFNFDSVYPFFVLVILLVLSVMITFRTSWLQGRCNFFTVSVSGIITSAGRLIFGLLFVLIGWKTFGAIFGLVAAQILTWLYVYSKTKNQVKKNNIFKLTWNDDLKKESFYGILVFFAMSSITFLYSSDVIIVKHYFLPEQAGLYSGIATVGRSIFFLAGSTAGVLLSSIKQNNSNKENQKIFIKSLIVVCSLTLPVLMIFSFYPLRLINLLIGAKYVSSAIFLPKISLVMFLVSIANLVIYYNLALRKFYLIPISIFTVAFVLVLNLFFHDSLYQIINNFLYGSVLIIALPFIYEKINFRNHSNI